MQENNIKDIFQIFFINSFISTNSSHQCRNCEILCFSNNKFYKHLRNCKRSMIMHESIDDTFQIIISNVKFNVANVSDDVNLRKWHYLMIKTSIIKDIFDFFCLNTKCDMSMIDRKYLKRTVLDCFNRIIIETVTKVRKIKTTIIISNESIKLEMKISDFILDKTAWARITEIFHLIDNLTTKILLKMNIIESERMKLNFKKLIIENCQEISVNLIFTISTEQKIKRVVTCSAVNAISSHFNKFIAAIVRDKFKHFSNRDFMFHSNHDKRLDMKDDVLFHVVNVNFLCVHIRNTFNDTVIISRRWRLNTLQEYENDECYLISSENTYFAFEQWIIHIQKLTIRALLITFNEKTLFNEIIIYDTFDTASILTKVANHYLRLWLNDEKIINISSEKWMSITLKSDAKIAAAKMYSLNSKEKQIVNQKFDKLHSQNRMQYSSKSTVHSYSVFVIWRTILRSDQKSVKKERVMIDIRTLNKITEIDTYSMSLQFDIIVSMIECKFIFIVDATTFFHQWKIKLFDRYKLTVVTHREQKQFNVDVMKFKNFFFYVQREIDLILRNFKKFCRIYIDDIVIFSKTFEEHVEHLHQIFELFTNLNISLSLTNFFFDYFTVQLLKLGVDVFELFTSKEKLKAISNLKFSKTFQDLKTYLEFTEWLRNYIFFFAQKSKSLQLRKNALIRLSFNNKKQSDKKFSRSQIINDVIQAKQNAYDQIQKVFARNSFFFHFDHARSLYLNIDVFKR